mmetsp:Transcript_40303/g.96655  ORF Transcript_40303/g.96655 Transcript_40303/m.96655 type:complete len:243 (+) Transcript_40303:565-1293(+)
MVSVLRACSSSRTAVALAIASPSCLIWSLSSWLSFSSLAMEAASSSTLAVSCSTSDVLSSRVTLLSCNSLLHHWWCWASSPASASSRSMRSEIICLTLAIGSPPAEDWEAICAASSAKVWDFRLCAFSCTNWKSLLSLMDLVWEDRNWSKEGLCIRLGRCFLALPATESLLRMSMAWPMAAISSLRVCCLISNSSVSFWHSAFKSDKVFTSSAWAAVVSLSSCSAWAAALLAEARAAALFSL